MPDEMCLRVCCQGIWLNISEEQEFLLVNVMAYEECSGLVWDRIASMTYRHHPNGDIVMNTSISAFWVQSVASPLNKLLTPKKLRTHGLKKYI